MVRVWIKYKNLCDNGRVKRKRKRKGSGKCKCKGKDKIFCDNGRVMVISSL